MEYGDEKCKKKLIFVGFYVVRFKSALNVTGTEKDLCTMTILQKIIYLKNYSKEVHTTNHRDVFYCYYVKPNTVLKYYSNTKFILYREKIERLFMPRQKYS